MEKKQKSISIKLPMASKILMILMCSLFSISVIAQNSGNGAVAIDENYKAYMDKNPASPLVKMYQHNPEIGQSYQAMRYAVILENPKNFGDFTQDDLQNMKNELKNLMVAIVNIDGMVQKGESYEKAAAMNTRQMSGKKSMDEQTRGTQINHDNSNAPATPTLTAPKQ